MCETATNTIVWASNIAQPGSIVDTHSTPDALVIDSFGLKIVCTVAVCEKGQGTQRQRGAEEIHQDS
jgi:hypothetical protein